MKFEQVSKVFYEIEQMFPVVLEMTRVLAELLKNALPMKQHIICNLSLGQLHAPLYWHQI